MAHLALHLDPGALPMPILLANGHGLKPAPSNLNLFAILMHDKEVWMDINVSNIHVSD